MGNSEKPFVVGIELGDDYSQVCYYNFIDEEPVSVKLSETTDKFRMITAVAKIASREEWYAGESAVSCSKLGEGELVSNLLTKIRNKQPVRVDDITVMPIELIEIYLDYLLNAAKTAGKRDNIDKICVTLDEFDITVLKVLKAAFAKIGINTDSVKFITKTEAFVFYATSARTELWKNDVMLFEYGADGLLVYRMYSATDRYQRIMMVHTYDYTEKMPHSKIKDKLNSENMDDDLCEVAKEVMEKKNICSVYLTGEAFPEDLNYPEFVKYLCNRRRVFAGQNLFVKGACFCACADYLNNESSSLLLACDGRVTTGINLNAVVRGKSRRIPLVEAGINWFDVAASYDFIVDDTQELRLSFAPLDKSEREDIVIDLSDIPKRPPKATRINVTLSFVDDSRCYIYVKDLGFGDFYKSVGNIITQEIRL